MRFWSIYQVINHRNVIINQIKIRNFFFFLIQYEVKPMQLSSTSYRHDSDHRLWKHICKNGRPSMHYKRRPCDFAFSPFSFFDDFLNIFIFFIHSFFDYYSKSVDGAFTADRFSLYPLFDPVRLLHRHERSANVPPGSLPNPWRWLWFYLYCFKFLVLPSPASPAVSVTDSHHGSPGSIPTSDESFFTLKRC